MSDLRLYMSGSTMNDTDLSHLSINQHEFSDLPKPRMPCKIAAKISCSDNNAIAFNDPVRNLNCRRSISMASSTSSGPSHTTWRTRFSTR